MRDELELKLAEEFPFMQQKKTLQEQKTEGRISDLYSAFGCEVGDGWYELLHDMCSEIMEAYQKAGEPVNLVVDQVKEKFGTLRFYYHFEGQPQALHAFDFLGGPSLRFRQEESSLQKEIADAVRKAERRSEAVCETCGKPGTLREDLRWILTLCDDCYGKRNNTPKNNSLQKEYVLE